MPKKLSTDIPWIPIDEDHQIRHRMNPANWELRTWYLGKSRDGTIKRQYFDTYHSKLETLMTYILENRLTGLESLEEIRDEIVNAKKEFTEIITGKSLGVKKRG